MKLRRGAENTMNIMDAARPKSNTIRLRKIDTDLEARAVCN
jgi:hypothetical protein